MALTVGCAPAWAADPAGADCALNKLAELPLRDDLGFLSAPVAVNGRVVSLIIDTGSEGSMVSPELARDLALPADSHVRTRVSGTGGEGDVVPNVIARSLRLGDVEFGPVSLPLGLLPGRPTIHPPVEGLLGGDVLVHDLLEMDVPGGRMAFWEQRADTEAGRSCAHPPARAGEKWQELNGEMRGFRLLLPVRLNGHDLLALLDSGARSRIVARHAAEAIGVSADELAVDPGGTTSGVDGRVSVYRWHRFQSLAVGAETERNPVLTVAPVSEPVDMLLGSDWFARHHVWIDYRHGRIFVAPKAVPRP